MYIIAVDMRESNNSIVFITNEFGNVAMYKTEQEALDVMKEQPLNVFPYRAISANELFDIMEPYPNKPISP